MFQAIDIVNAAGQSFGERLSSQIYAILYMISYPSSSYLIPHVSLIGILMVVFALRARLTTGARSRGWVWAFWVTAAMSMIGFAQFFAFNRSIGISNTGHIFFELVMLVYPFIILRAGKRTTNIQKAESNFAEKSRNLAHPVLTGGSIILGPALFTALAAGVLVQLDIVTVITPSQFLPVDPGLYMGWVLQHPHTFFIGIAGFISVYAATRPTGQETEDLPHLARYLWFSAVVVTGALLVLHYASDFFFWVGMPGDTAAEVAAIMSLILLAVTPGISPFRKFASGGFWRKTVMQKGQ